MKRIAILVMSLACMASGQAPPVLGAAQAVDIRVKTIDWHPSGELLLYAREEESGVGLGLYRLGDLEGSVLLHLGKDDQWSSKWFRGSNAALLIVKRKLEAAGSVVNEASVYLLEAGVSSAQQLFSRSVGVGEEISVDSELSPSLTHAICKVRVGKESYATVLPVNGRKLVASRDIDQAEARGLSGPGWSRDGTALYGEGLGSGTATIQLGGLSGTGALQGGGQSGTFVLQLSGASGEITSADGSSPVKMLLKFQPTAPPAGTPVLEVVPTNGVLRQVRSPGPWVEPQRAANTLSTESHRAWLDFDRSRGGANSLWLTWGSKEEPQRVLAAAHADSAAISPADRAVAYITDGALFVRRVSARTGS